MRANREGGNGKFASDRNAAFGSRRNTSNARNSGAKSSAGGEGDVVITGREDGPRDITWTPSASSGKGKSREGDAMQSGKKGWTGKDKRERFGAGMERGGPEDAAAALKHEERHGRTHRRTGIRSGSRNVFRKL
jgi:ribosome biogenesis protein ENP2